MGYVKVTHFLFSLYGVSMLKDNLARDTVIDSFFNKV